MKKVLIAFIFLIVFSFIIQKISGIVLIDRNSYELPQGFDVVSRSVILPRLNFDGRNYLDIATRGYFMKGIYNLRVFYPMYPLSIYLFSMGGIVNPIYVGLVLSGMFCFFSLYLIHKMSGFKTLLLVLVFPTSFYLISYYTESLFLFISLLFFLFLKQKKYWIAGIMVAIATATRSVGLALIPVLAFEIYKNKFKDWKSIFIAPMGLIFYMIYTQIQTGDFMQIFSSQKVWGRELGLLAPFKTIYISFSNIISGPHAGYDNQFVYPVIIIEFLMLLFALFVFVKSYRIIDRVYWIYTFATLFIVLMGGTLSSLPRYLLLVFPISIYIAKVLDGKKLYLYVIISIILNIFMTSLFMRNYWIS